MSQKPKPWCPQIWSSFACQSSHGITSLVSKWNDCSLFHCIFACGIHSKVKYISVKWFDNPTLLNYRFCFSGQYVKSIVECNRQDSISIARWLVLSIILAGQRHNVKLYFIFLSNAKSGCFFLNVINIVPICCLYVLYVPTFAHIFPWNPLIYDDFWVTSQPLSGTWSCPCSGAGRYCSDEVAAQVLPANTPAGRVPRKTWWFDGMIWDVMGLTGDTTGIYIYIYIEREERWRDGEMERWRDGEMERWRDR